jgi:hypothetical protein
MTFPGSLAVGKLNAKSEEFAENLPWMEKIRLLDEGGPCFEKSLDAFLKRRPSEPNEMYRLRREMASYTNIVGTANGWYLAKLFEDDPVIDQISAENKPLTPDATDFFAQFITNCDRGGWAT